MKIKYGGNKMSAKICEINDFEYLQKLIYTENNVKNHPALFNHPKINTTPTNF